ncbi:OpgC family protein [Coralliovum pocilloporae]|uniref:OpgC family protein n=1 Tax=Coralliovum pocilloporae TaxID=3066369 RepID=UPI003306C137
MSATSAQAKKKPRDPRLDFFRGIAMFIIFIAHVPGNSWTMWIPARFGYSDATEIFVFCSGMASSFAFASVFVSHGWWMGAARISHRIWQVYWAQIGLFFVIAGMLWAMEANKEALISTLAGTFDPTVHTRDFVGALNLRNFFNDPGTNLVGLMTLTYVPNYFDILPMYLGILALIPAVMLAHRYGGMPLVIALSVVLWTWANLSNFDAFISQLVGSTDGIGLSALTLQLPAEPWTERPWFFNPFAWQLVFFTGFAFGLGWLKQPPVRKGLIILAIAVVLINIPLRFHLVLRNIPDIQDVIGFFPDTREWRDFLRPLGQKTEFGVLRYIHFLALAYLAWAAFGRWGWALLESPVWSRTINVIRKVGQQSLAVFLVSMVASRGIGEIIWIFERTELARAIGNLSGFAMLIATAYTVSWYKSQPWRKVAPSPATNAFGDATPPVRQPAE